MAAAQSFYRAVLVPPAESPRSVRNAEPRCSAAVSARSDRTAKRKQKQGNMLGQECRLQLLQFELEPGEMGTVKTGLVILNSDCQLWLNLTSRFSILFSLCYYVF